MLCKLVASRPFPEPSSPHPNQLLLEETRPPVDSPSPLFTCPVACQSCVCRGRAGLSASWPAACSPPQCSPSPPSLAPHPTLSRRWTSPTLPLVTLVQTHSHHHWPRQRATAVAGIRDHHHPACYRLLSEQGMALVSNTLVKTGDGRLSATMERLFPILHGISPTTAMGIPVTEREIPVSKLKVLIEKPYKIWRRTVPVSTDTPRHHRINRIHQKRYRSRHRQVATVRTSTETAVTLILSMTRSQPLRQNP